MNADRHIKPECRQRGSVAADGESDGALRNGRQRITGAECSQLLPVARLCLQIEVQLKADREPNCQEAATRCHCKYKKMTTTRVIKVTDLLAQGRLYKYKNCNI